MTKLGYSSPVPVCINITDCHNNHKSTLGAIDTSVTIDQVKYPLIDVPLRIHLTESLSSELILGTNFLSKHNAVISLKDNTVAFLPEEASAISICEKTIIAEAAAALAVPAVPENELAKHELQAFAVQPMEDVQILVNDQRQFKAKIITDEDWTFKPGAEVVITGSMGPYPAIADGIYTVEENNVVSITVKNILPWNQTLLAARPIPGIVVERLDTTFHKQMEIGREEIRTMLLADEAIRKATAAGIMPQEAAAAASDYITDTVWHEQRPDSLAEHFRYLRQAVNAATSALVASGLDPPGKTELPPAPTQEVIDNLKSQFDSSKIADEWKDKYVNLVLENWDCFALHKFDVGYVPHYNHQIDSTTEDPIYVKQFKIPVADEAALSEMADDLTAAGVLIPQTSVHNTPIFMVAKRGAGSGSKRFVQDFRKRNMHSREDRFSIRDVRESITAVGRTRPRVFSKSDFCGAFYQLGLHPQSQPLTSFTLPFRGQSYSWARTPMGLRGSSSSFSKLIAIIFNHLDNVITYVDDLIATSNSHPNMIKLLAKIFKECRYHGLKMNLKKCEFGVEEISWLGYSLSANGVAPELCKAEAVKAMQLPTTVKQVQQHLGFFQFFCHLIDHYALIAAPLSAVTSENHPWRSTKLSGPLPLEAQDAWYKLRQIVSNAPTIAFPDFSLPFYLFCDASVGKPNADPPTRGGIAAVLTQVIDDKTRPVGFFSRQLRDSETRYSAYSAEMLSLCASLDHFYTFLKNAKVTAFTDHLPVLKNSTRESNTLNHLQQKINEMDINLVHIPGSEMPADVLSRQAMEDFKNHNVSTANIFATLPQTMSTKQWKLEQDNDSICKAIKSFIVEKKASKSPVICNIIKLFGPNSTIDPETGLLYYHASRTKRMATRKLWVPKSLYPMILSNGHGSTLSGHFKEELTFEKLSVHYFWPSMAMDLTDFIKTCQVCHAEQDRKSKRTKAPLRPWGPATYRNQRVHIDLVGRLRSEDDSNYILTMTDAFTRWVELAPISNKETITVAKAFLDSYCCRYGFPAQVVSDAGSEFVSEVVKELMALLKVKHHVISPYSPAVNGLIERVHRTLGQYIRAFCDESTTNWKEFLPSLQFALNTRVHSATSHSAYFLTFAEHPIYPWAPTAHLTYSESDIADKVRLLQFAQNLVYQNDTAAKAASKRAFDIKSKKAQFKAGDQVLLHCPSPPPGSNSKFYRPWRGIYTILEKTSDLTYLVRKKGGRKLKAHVNRLKFFDPINHHEAPEVYLSLEEDEEENDQPTHNTQLGQHHPLVSQQEAAAATAQPSLHVRQPQHQERPQRNPNFS